MPLLLSESDVQRLLPLDDLISHLEGALRAFSTGGVAQPLRSVLEVGPERGYYGVMPAAIVDPPAAGTKIVTVFKNNAARGLPSHLATILLHDVETGALLAILDGRYITEARTGAVSAVSARHMSRGEGPMELAILGSGVQAKSHLEALAHVRTIREARVWSPSVERRERFAAAVNASLEPGHAPDPAHAQDQARAHAHAQDRGDGRGQGHGRLPHVRAVGSAREAVAGADLIVTVTASTTAVLESDWVKNGAHIMAVGACRPDQREMSADLVARSRLIVDSRTGALSEAGDIVLSIAEGRIGPGHIAGELGEVIAGRVAGRTSPDEVTIFKSLGMAVEDVAAARLAYLRAVEAGAGVAVSL